MRGFQRRRSAPTRREISCYDCGARSTGPGWSWLAFDVQGGADERRVAIVCRRCAETRLAPLVAPL